MVVWLLRGEQVACMVSRPLLLRTSAWVVPVSMLGKETLQLYQWPRRIEREWVQADRYTGACQRR